MSYIYPVLLLNLLSSSFSSSMRKQIIIVLSLLTFAGCAPSVYYVKPSDWRTPEKQDSTIRYYSQFFKGWKFYVDPGHGGEDRFNHGPAYDVIEPDINLKVGVTLAGYLRRAGADVILSRDKDTTVGLSDRPRLSNASGAQIFISVHHNAVGGSQDRFTNFTSVWYHARETDPEYNACNQDIARYIQRDLAYAMGNPGSLGSFDGTMSDYSIYPNAGFAVLRLAQIPAVLIEGSFFSSAYEEQRLRREEFNTIEAWGAFKGIGRYLKAGIPQLAMISDSVTAEFRPTLVFRASDSSGINKKSIIIKVDNIEIDAVLQPDSISAYSGMIYCVPPVDLANGAHLVSVVVRNGNGNASFPFRRTIVVKPPVDSLVVTLTPREIPPLPDALTAVNVKAYDKKGNPCTDGTEISLSATLGTIAPTIQIRGGEAQAYYVPDTVSGIARITASAPKRSATARLSLRHSIGKFITGIVYNIADSTPVANVLIVSRRESSMPGFLPQSARSYSDGRYILTDAIKDTLRLDISREGFFGTNEVIPVASELSVLYHFVTPIANGILRGKTFVLDARYGGIETGSLAQHGGRIVRTSDVTLAVAKSLQQLLIAAGATVLQVRKHDIALSDTMRIEYALNAKEGLFIRIDGSDTSHQAGVFVDPTVARKPTGSSLLWGLAATLHCDTLGVRSGRTPLFDAIPFDALNVILPAVSDTIFSVPVPYATDRCAWGIYRGLLRTYGFQESAASTVEMPKGSAASYKKILLDNSLTTMSAADGSYTFYGVEGNKGVIRILEE
jgi:N-acetylmuramoyl-L-alanine amidase